MKEKQGVAKNQKWKDVLLRIALILQCVKIAVAMLILFFQKTILTWLTSGMFFQYSRDCNFLIPINSIVELIISTIVFAICYALIKWDRDDLHIGKEVLSIVLLMPVYSFLNTILLGITSSGRIISDNYAFYFTTILENIYTAALHIFKYSLILLAIVAAVSIGQKIKNTNKSL